VLEIDRYRPIFNFMPTFFAWWWSLEQGSKRVATAPFGPRTCESVISYVTAIMTVKLLLTVYNLLNIGRYADSNFTMIRDPDNIGRSISVSRKWYRSVSSLFCF